MARLSLFRTFLLHALFTSLALAQAPEETQEDQPPLFEIPETRVVGTPFPTAPAEGDEALSPNPTPIPLSETGSSVTVITQEQMRQSREVTVAELLRRVQGLDVVRTGGVGSQTSVFMRGASSAHTKVLLDGIPLNDPSNPGRAFDFGNLMVEDIERIEILRGPQSILYGSNALGGVINITTKRGSGPPQATYRFMGGDFRTHQEGASASGGSDKFYYSASYANFESGSISTLSRRFGGFETDPYRNNTTAGRFGWTPAPWLNVDYVFRYIEAEKEIDGFLTDDPIAFNRTRAFYNRIQLQSLFLDGDVQQTVGFSVSDYDRSNPTGFTPIFNGQNRQFDYLLNVLLTDRNVFTIGSQYWVEQSSTDVIPNYTQRMSSIFIHDTFQLGQRLFGTLGFRWDEHNNAGFANTYRYTTRYVLDTGTALHGSIGTAFRAPAIAETQPGYFGFNPNLRPEQSKGWDVGCQQQFFGGSLVVDATYFRNDFKDLIVNGPGPLFQLANIDNALATGAELNGTWILSDVTTLTANYTRTDTRDLATGQQLLRRPRNKASLGVHRTFADNQLRMDFYLTYIGKRLDFVPFTPGPLPSYILADLVLHAQLTERAEAFLRIDNVLNEQYEEAYAFGAPNLSMFGGVTVRW